MSVDTVYIGERRLREEARQKYIGSGQPPMSIAEADARLEADGLPPMTPEERVKFRAALEGFKREAENIALQQRLYGTKPEAQPPAAPTGLRQAGEAVFSKVADVGQRMLAPEVGTPPLDLGQAGKGVVQEGAKQVAGILPATPQATPKPVSPAEEDAQMMAQEAEAAKGEERAKTAQEAPGVINAIQRGFDETVAEVSGLLGDKEVSFVQQIAGKNLPAKIADVLLAALPSTTIKNTVADLFMQVGVEKDTADGLGTAFSIAGSVGYALTDLPSLFSLTKNLTKAALTGGSDAVKAVAQSERVRSLASAASAVFRSQSGLPEAAFVSRAGREAYQGLAPGLRQIVDSVASGAVETLGPGVRRTAGRIAKIAEEAVAELPASTRNALLEAIDPGGALREGAQDWDSGLLATRIGASALLAYTGYNTTEDHELALAAALPFIPKKTAMRILEAMRDQAGEIRKIQGKPEVATVFPAAALDPTQWRLKGRPGPASTAFPQGQAETVMESLAGDIAAGDKIVRLNWATVREPGALDAVLKAVMDARGIGEESRIARTDEVAEELAEALGVSPEYFLGVNPQSMLNSTEIRAFTSVVNASRARLVDLYKRHKIGEPNLWPEIQNQLGVMALITERGLNWASEWGHAGRAWQQLRTELGSTTWTLPLRKQADIETDMTVRQALIERWLNREIVNPLTADQLIELNQRFKELARWNPGEQATFGGEIGSYIERTAGPNPMEGLERLVGKTQLEQRFAGTENAITPPLTSQEEVVRAAESGPISLRQIARDLEPNAMEALEKLAGKASVEQQFAGTKGAVTPPLTQQEEVAKAAESGPLNLRAAVKEQVGRNPLEDLGKLAGEAQFEPFLGTKNAIKNLTPQEQVVKQAETPSASLRQLYRDRVAAEKEFADAMEMPKELIDLMGAAILEIPEQAHPGLIRRWLTNPNRDIKGVIWDAILNSLLFTVQGNQADYLSQTIMSLWKVAELTVAGFGPETMLGAAAGAAAGAYDSEDMLGAGTGALVGGAAGLAARVGLRPAEHRRMILEGPLAMIGAVHGFTEAVVSSGRVGNIARMSAGGAIGGAAGFAATPEDATIKEQAIGTFTGMAAGMGAGALSSLAMRGRPNVLDRTTINSLREIPVRPPMEIRLGLDREILQDDPASVVGWALDYLRTGLNFGGKVMQAPGEFMKSTEMFWKLIDKRMVQWSEAGRMAVQQVEAASGKNRLGLLTDPKRAKDMAQWFKSHLRLYMHEGDPRVEKLATDFADYATFTSPLGSWSKPMDETIKAVAPLHFMTMFFRTPVNVMKTYFDTVPGLNFLAIKTTSELKHPDKAVRENAYARLALGSLMGATGFYLAMNGVITPRTLRRDPASRIQSKEEVPEYSLKIGNPEAGPTKGTYVELSRLGLLGQHLMLSADLYNLSRLMVTENVGREEWGEDFSAQATGAVMAVSMSIANVLLHPTYFAQWSTLLKALNPDDPSQSGSGRKVLGNILGMAIPTAIGQYARGTDTMERATMGLLDQLFAKIPGARTSLLFPEVNLAGEHVANSDTGGLAEAFMVTKFRDPKNDPVSKFLMERRINLTQPDRTVFGPPTPMSRAPKPEDGVNLDNQEHYWLKKLAGGDLKIPTNSINDKLVEWGFDPVDLKPGKFVGFWEIVGDLIKTPKFNGLARAAQDKTIRGIHGVFKSSAEMILATGKEFRAEKSDRWRVPDSLPEFPDLADRWLRKLGQRAEDMLTDEEQIGKVWQKVDKARERKVFPPVESMAR
jgi:hypothetical protein